MLLNIKKYNVQNTYLFLIFFLKCGRILNRYVPPSWAKVAAKMYIPFDEELQFHPEFDDFHNGLKTKQADAILAGYPLMYDMTKQVLVIFVFMLHGLV